MPICLTFDDGDASLYTTVYPMMEAYGVQGTAFVCGELTKGGEHAVTVAQLREMHTAGWEIASHTFSHAHLVASGPLVAEAEIEKNIEWFSKVGLPRPAGFSYPWGAYNDEIIPLAMQQHSYARATVATRPSVFDRRYRLRSIVLSCGTKMSDITKLITMAAAENSLIIFHGHRVAPEVDTYTYTPQALQGLIRHAVASGMPVVPLEQAVCI